MTNITDNKEYLHLKWGTLKRWNFVTDKTMAAVEKYNEAGSVSISGMMQKDNGNQKEALCGIIDALDAETIHLDWDGIDVSKEEAKRYVMEYGQ